MSHDAQQVRSFEHPGEGRKRAKSTPKGRQIDKKGLTPDVYVQRTTDDRKAGRDPQLDMAVQVLTDIINGTAIPTSVPTAVPTPTP